METAQVTTTVVSMLWYHWIFYILIATLGAMASSLVVNKGKFIMPQLPKSESNDKVQIMGFTGDIIVGIAAAFAVWWATTPQTLFQVIGIAAVAGYGGSTILQSLVNKLKADTSETQLKTQNLKNTVLSSQLKQNSNDEGQLTEASLEAFLTNILSQNK